MITEFDAVIYEEVVAISKVYDCRFKHSRADGTIISTDLSIFIVPRLHSSQTLPTKLRLSGNKISMVKVGKR